MERHIYKIQMKGVHFNVKFMRRGLAFMLAVLLILPTLPASAEEPASSKPEVTEGEAEPSDVEKKEENKEESKEENKPEELPAATPSNASPDKERPLEGEDKKGEIRFNTGNHEWSIVDKEVFDKGTGDGFFEDDGSYTINIPEENPFFPYEVQFTCQDEVTSQWFMTPDDSVQIGEHTFYVSAHFDDTVVTQMSLDVAGDTVVVYPEAKKFTNDGDGTDPISLLPLTERSLTADLSGYTPAELTMVSLSSIFQGSNALKPSDKVAWSFEYDDDYTVSTAGGMVNLSRYTTFGISRWQMIVGDGTQLNTSNVRNIVSLTVTGSEEWLKPVVYTQSNAGKRTSVEIVKNEYYDYDKNNRRCYITVPFEKIKDTAQAYVGLSVNPAVFGSTKYDHFKIYEGQYTDASKAVNGTDITAKICNTNMAQANAGYLLKKYTNQWITMVTFDKNNKVTGCLPFLIYLSTSRNFVSPGSLYYRTADSSVNVSSGTENLVSEKEGYENYVEKLYAGYASKGTYYLTMNYYVYGSADSETAKAVTAAYVGDYTSIAQAGKAGAKNIKDVLFSRDSSTGGYAADYSQGVNFTVFVGADGTAKQEVYHLNVKAEESEITANGSTNVWFYGLKDSSGADIPCYVVDAEEDSYAEYSYLTILVGPDVDTTSLAPVFSTSKGINLYSAGASSPEVSGKSLHDFSKGPVHYTSSSENKENQKNYWLQVVKATNGAGWLYINSLSDSDSKTTKEGGVTRSTREVMLNGYYDYRHDILLANMGTDALADLSVELSSAVLELDGYWTLNGSHDLSGFSTVQSTQSHGELPNLAKIRVKAKSNVGKGTDVSGTLTIKSGSTTLVVLNLTGLIGDPCITTETIPQAVKYVPYGTMIQNNNKYSFNKVTYRLLDGELPEGMEVKPNGELYGVPKAAGTFTFTVQMNNSWYDFSDDEKTYTLTVLENTDANVDGATDTGYSLTERIQDIYLGNLPSNSAERGEALSKVLAELAANSQTMVSQGQYVEFVDIFLDGRKLSEGTDYTSNSGSTRITISGETLAGESIGTHTLGIEFRTGDDQTLKRAAQNYRIIAEEAPNKSGGSSGSSGRSGGHSSEGSANYATVVMRLVDASGKAMPGLTLELHSTPKITKTDQNGISVFYGVESGRHTIYVKDQNGNVLASKKFEVVFGDTTLLNGSQIIIKKGATSTLNMQLSGNELTFLTLQAGDVYQVVPAGTGDEGDFGFWFVRWLVFAGIGAVIYWWYEKRKKINI